MCLIGDAPIFPTFSPQVIFRKTVLLGGRLRAGRLLHARRRRAEARPVRADDAFRRSPRRIFMHNLRQLALCARPTSIAAG
jgi:hypothetical protein